jgi:hypothetical protein
VQFDSALRQFFLYDAEFCFGDLSFAEFVEGVKKGGAADFSGADGRVDGPRLGIEDLGCFDDFAVS